MSTQSAIVIQEDGDAGIAQIPIPKPSDDWVLVKVKAVALNPTDWKHVDYSIAGPGARVGCDYAGVVEEVGSKVTKFKKGDRIAGFVHGCDRSNHENGSFGDYLVAKASIQLKIPESISDVEAATLGVSTITVGQNFYKAMGLPMPDCPAKEPFLVLIYAASTATGIFAVQYAKLSGLTVIATASPHNFAYLRSLGADMVFDYKSETCPEDIKEYTQNKLRHTLDCTSTGTETCAFAMSDNQPGFYGVINAADEDLLEAVNPNVKGPLETLAYDAPGENYVWDGKDVTPDQSELEFATRFATLTEGLLADGKIKPIKLVVNKTGEGLKGALAGLDELRNGLVSAVKLVYTL